MKQRKTRDKILKECYKELPEGVKKILKNHRILIHTIFLNHGSKGFLFGKVFPLEKCEYMVLFPDYLWKLSKKDIKHTIFHEFAHLYLIISKKKNSELNANKFAFKWLGDYKGLTISMCVDCYQVHYPKDMFILKKKLWDKYSKRAFILCKACFEKRLGRKLKPEDFCKLKINEQWIKK